MAKVCNFQILKSQNVIALQQKEQPVSMLTKEKSCAASRGAITGAAQHVLSNRQRQSNARDRLGFLAAPIFFSFLLQCWRG